MHTQIAGNAAIDAPSISTGHLPPEELVKALVVETYDRFKSNNERQNSQVYRRSAEVPSLMRPRNRMSAEQKCGSNQG